jgi:hypothetical protein
MTSELGSQPQDNIVLKVNFLHISSGSGLGLIAQPGTLQTSDLIPKKHSVIS